ncbi:MAG TPA: GGDEF domain-containing protein [Fervidobacterium sp.]|nr:GGDEF domain-containing protein [Fervidobacterium sp.]HOL03809.1 GGDEF domain-containing protein [Fervidobacterium sp.]HPC79284.1 GGDEF domain-containing protein [Fervidobacterium sp.]HRB91725.1 GGDEF domain-containing protein [Fervidobacterium sp.]HRT01407.1 GGDEF domain-containing protein [Fervidobacterium sp.]
MEKKTMNKADSTDEILTMFIKFSDYLLKISSDRETSLKRKDYEALLKIAVDNLSFVHSGSVLMTNEDEEFYYIATYNHDYELLKDVRFKKPEMVMRRFKQTYIIKRRSLDLVKELSSKIGEDDNSVKHKVQSVDNIKAFVSMPIRVQRRVIGFFNLDSWESEDIFEKKNFQPYAEMMSRLISISAERFELIKILKEQNEQLTRNTLTDTLTHLPNLRALGNYFDRYIELANRSLNNLYFLYIDINDFDKIVHTYDAEFGENLIRKLSKHLSSLLRKSDILGRIENSSFGILTLSRDIPKPLINRLRQGIVDFSKKLDLDLDVSVGLAEYGPDGKDLDALLKKAKTYKHVFVDDEKLAE